MAQISAKTVKIQYLLKCTSESNKNSHNASLYAYSSYSWVSATLKKIFFMCFFSYYKTKDNAINLQNLITSEIYRQMLWKSTQQKIKEYWVSQVGYYIKNYTTFMFHVVPLNCLYHRVDDIFIDLDQLSAVADSCHFERT